MGELCSNFTKILKRYNRSISELFILLTMLRQPFSVFFCFHPRILLKPKPNQPIYRHRVSNFYRIFAAATSSCVAIGLMLSINHLYEMPVIRPSPINPSNSSLSDTVPIAIYDITRCVTPDARLSSNVIHASLLYCRRTLLLSRVLTYRTIRVNCYGHLVYI